jgi:hypothetical protein
MDNCLSEWHWFGGIMYAGVEDCVSKYPEDKQRRPGMGLLGSLHFNC